MPDATALAAAIRSGEVSAREVTETAIARIEEHNPALNAVVGTRFEQALAEVDAGLPDGPLRGVPMLIKNLGADVAGLPTTRGSRLFADVVPQRDSELVRRYRAAGMVVLGTTNSPELGQNASTEPLLFGPARNPWQTGHSTGGSSGGSAAAVAAGLTPVAHGNDGGGSIRIPSAMCGLFGLKPSRGRVSSAPDAGTLSRPVSINHALTTTVRDSALLLDLTAGGLHGEALAAPSVPGGFAAAAGRSPGQLRIALITALRGGPDTAPECVDPVRRIARVCESLGHVVTEIEAPFDSADVGATLAAMMSTDAAVAIDDRLAELGRPLADDDLEPFTRFLYEHYRGLPAVELSRALRNAQQLGWQIGTAFERYDLLLTPIFCRPTPALGVMDTTNPQAMFEQGPLYAGWTSPFNVTGMPAMSVPHGIDGRGLPLAVHVVADLGREDLLLGLAGQLEQAAPWPRVAPGYPS